MRSTAPDCFNDLLAAVPVADSWKLKLRLLMSGAERFYHDTNHVAQLFERHRRFAPEAGLDGPTETRLIACAIAFHDCVYDSRRSDNEERSAQVWLEASGDVDAAERAWVADTIRATSDHLGHGERSARARPGTPEALRLWMLDLDLSPFGEAPDLFDRDARLLRAEAPHLDDATFDTTRFRFLQRLAEAPVIYRTATIATRFDAPARSNIARHLAADRRSA